jgi:signal recognition particle subunit SRP54
MVLKSFTYIMDSMTSAELDDPKIRKLMTPSRVNRIARGSGRSIMEVNNLIASYTKFEDVVKKIGKMNFKAMTQDPGSLLSGRMGQQQMAQLAKALNPQMLKQMGGLGGLQGMMKQMANLGLK